MSATRKLANGPALKFIINGSPELERRIGSATELRKELGQILANAGQVASPVLLKLSDTAKGTTHTKGLRFKPVLSRRMIEVSAHFGDNSERYILLMSVPHGMDTVDFHSRLEKAKLQTESARSEDAHSGNGTSKSAKTPALWPQIMQEIWNLSPETNIVSRADCLRVLRELGTDDPEDFFSSIADGKRLIPLSGSQEMFRLSPQWITQGAQLVRSKSGLVGAVSPVSPASNGQVHKNTISTSEVVTRLKELTDKLEASDRSKARLVVIDNAIGEARSRIQSEETSISSLEGERTEILASMAETRATVEALSKILG
jgi:hypothetical protein